MRSTNDDIQSDSLRGKQRDRTGERLAKRKKESKMIAE